MDLGFLSSVYEASVVAFVIFIGQDYLRFRFSPPYMTKESCSGCRRDCQRDNNNREDMSKEKDALLSEFIGRMDARLNRMEAMIFQLGIKGVKHE